MSEFFSYVKELSKPKVCPICAKWSITVKKRSNGLAYINEDMNYNTACLECMNEILKRSADLWADYYYDRF